MKTSHILITVIAVIAIVVFIDYKVSTYVPPIPKEVKKFDAEKVGKTLGDMKRDFIKGFNDTTKVKTDSIK